VARIIKAPNKPFAIVDSNVIVYAMVNDVSSSRYHQTCLSLIEKGFKGELDYVLGINPVIVVEVFSVLRKILSCNEAESRVNLLLRSKRIAFLQISKEECQNAIKWAKEKNIPVNDALIAANAVEYAQLVFTVDEEHFKKLEKYGVKISNPVK
jgi:predicted nucleic acid-binding protein